MRFYVKLLQDRCSSAVSLSCVGHPDSLLLCTSHKNGDNPEKTANCCTRHHILGDLGPQRQGEQIYLSADSFCLLHLNLLAAQYPPSSLKSITDPSTDTRPLGAPGHRRSMALLPVAGQVQVQQVPRSQRREAGKVWHRCPRGSHLEFPSDTSLRQQSK